MIYFVLFVISQKAHCWCLFAWEGLPAHSCVHGVTKQDVPAVACCAVAQWSHEANTAGLPEENEQVARGMGRGTFGYSDVVLSPSLPCPVLSWKRPRPRLGGTWLHPAPLQDGRWIRSTHVAFYYGCNPAVFSSHLPEMAAFCLN